MATFMVGNKRYIEYVVQKNDILLALARTHWNGDTTRWKEIIKKNENDGHPGLHVPPNTIYPNQILGFPDDTYFSPDFDGMLTVIASWGVNMRTEGDHQKGSLIGIPQSETKYKSYYYKKSSVTKRDNHLRVWAEVRLDPPFNGHSTGWLPINGPDDTLNNTGQTNDWVSPHIPEKASTPLPIVTPNNPAIAALDMQFALGQITEKDYLHKKAILGG